VWELISAAVNARRLVLLPIQDAAAAAAAAAGNDVTQLLNACADVLKTRRSSSETFYTSLFHQNC